ncbi:hypothetical protein BP5796_00275 [Coleophoma crateriformis]|uniref:Beta-lactamase-related domain-containing protein n=1 Tax=Coleophoma crateriformis TaxID=565419 RepID=A0A3D8T7F0_9HELO|nr:hypothetical protein BP5796_00275 [Coleophoma crateriformis]
MFALPSLHSWAYLPLAVAVIAAGQQSPLTGDKAGPFTHAFERLANETLELWQVPGISVAVIDGDDVWAEGYGFATLPDVKATPETLWYAGSTTKAFTAAVLATLVDDNSNYSHVQWDTPISALIHDDFVLQDEYVTSHLTIEDALSHRTGMPRHEFSYGGYYSGHKAVPRDIVRSLRHLPLTFELRTTYSYCNLMFVVASHVVETLTGSWLGDVIYERIWKPIGMESTYFSTQAALQAPEPVAQGYTRISHGNYQDVPYMDLTDISGAGSVISNVLDYAKWIKALVSKTVPLSPASMKSIWKGRSIIPEPQDGWAYTGEGVYALGWIVRNYKGYQIVEHSGGMEAFSTELILIPELKYGVVGFGNTATTAAYAELRLLWHLIDEKLGIPESERWDWNKENQKSVQASIEDYNNATSIYYPHLPSPKLPLTLPIAAYTGTYHNAGYQNMTVTLTSEGSLHIDRTNATWKMLVDLEHVSGDYFIARLDSSVAPGSLFKEAVAAEFRIGSDGVPVEFGLAAEPMMGKEGRIWFKRI